MGREAYSSISRGVSKYVATPFMKLDKESVRSSISSSGGPWLCYVKDPSGKIWQAVDRISQCKFIKNSKEMKVLSYSQFHSIKEFSNDN